MNPTLFCMISNISTRVLALVLALTFNLGTRAAVEPVKGASAGTVPPQTKSDRGQEAEWTEEQKRAFVEKLLVERGLLDPRGWNFPKTASEYAKMVEPHLGVPPRIDLSEAVEIPLYVNGVRSYGNLGQALDNPSLLGKDTVSGSTLQRHEGRTAAGVPLPDVVWVSFGRNSTRDPAKILGSVQMIGYHRKTGATAFFESSDQIHPWVRLDRDTQRMRGVMPWIDNPEQFNRARNACSATKRIRSSQTRSSTPPRSPARLRTWFRFSIRIRRITSLAARDGICARYTSRATSASSVTGWA